MANQDYKATFYFKWGHTAGGSTFPLAWVILVPFILAASLNVYAFACLGTNVFANKVFILFIKYKKLFE